MSHHNFTSEASDFIFIFEKCDFLDKMRIFAPVCEMIQKENATFFYSFQILWYLHTSGVVEELFGHQNQEKRNVFFEGGKGACHLRIRSHHSWKIRGKGKGIPIIAPRGLVIGIGFSISSGLFLVKLGRHAVENFFVALCDLTEYVACLKSTYRSDPD